MIEQEEQTWLTQDAYDRLSEELTDLRDNQRKEIAKKIEIAREEGDLKENAGYHAAKDEQGKLEARIRHLENLLKNATIGESHAKHDRVEPGALITAKIAGNKVKFLLGNREIAAGVEDYSVYSEKSPLGAAIMNLKVGEKTSYRAPSGSEIKVEILKLESL